MKDQTRLRGYEAGMLRRVSAHSIDIDINHETIEEWHARVALDDLGYVTTLWHDVPGETTFRATITITEEGRKWLREND